MSQTIPYDNVADDYAEIAALVAAGWRVTTNGEVFIATKPQ
ncbi:hypothetical protein [Deefgea piscis]|nr:hypothetical protein [Deefgea piscis]